MHNAHRPIHVYIGDSLTDLECLKDADIGICMYTKDQSALKEVFARCGQPVSHISDYEVARDVDLYYANDFEEILQSRLLDSPDANHT
jgi:thiamine phosphate phosphatase / amino-HMP aminohydrolase